MSPGSIPPTKYGLADVEPRHHQHHDADRRDPVHGPERQAPEVHPPVLADRVRDAAPEEARRPRCRPAGSDRVARAGHWTLTSVIGLPSMSSTCTPHARQGSNEWIVRMISSGWSALGERMIVHQRRFVRARLPLVVARRAVPRAWHHALVPGELPVLDLHPVPQRATRHVGAAEALALGRPGGRIPLVPREGGNVAVRDPLDELVHPLVHLPRDQHRLHAPRRVRPGVEKSAAGPTFSVSIVCFAMAWMSLCPCA